MKNYKLFQYAIFYVPTEKEAKDGVKAQILVDVTNVLAPDDKTVAIIASRQIPEQYLEKLDQVNIVVRPF